MDEKTEQFKKTFFGLNGRYPTEKEIEKSMRKFINEEDELLLADEMDIVDVSNDNTVINIDNEIQESVVDQEIENADQSETDNNNQPNVIERIEICTIYIVQFTLYIVKFTI